jgi:hypothetical protein
MEIPKLPLPWWEGIEGRGMQGILLLQYILPHPNPLPSRERGEVPF